MGGISYAWVCLPPLIIHSVVCLWLEAEQLGADWKYAWTKSSV